MNQILTSCLAFSGIKPDTCDWTMCQAMISFDNGKKNQTCSNSNQGKTKQKKIKR